MNDKITISTFQLFNLFPDSDSARLYLESRLWPNGVKCPICASGERVTARKDGYYRCNACSLDFTCRTGTIMERSHIGLRDWLVATGTMVAYPDISSINLAAEINATQKSAWAMQRRLREATGGFAVGDTLDRAVGRILKFSSPPKSAPAKQRLRDKRASARGNLVAVQKRRRTNRHPLYHVWATMLQRCTNPRNKKYLDYGKRGISVCDRWRTFANFVADMGERPKGTTLERSNNNGHYEPTNCKWATWHEQARNRRPQRKRSLAQRESCI